jgi:hypothetical protein
MTRFSRSYSLTASLIAVIGFLQPGAAAGHKPTASLSENLTYGRAVTRAVWKDEILFFFEGKAGEAITLSVTSKSPGIDPHVAILDPDGKKEASDDDSGGQGNSLIKNHVLKKSGRYTVKVGTAERREGRVEVLLEKVKVRARKQ